MGNNWQIFKSLIRQLMLLNNFLQLLSSTIHPILNLTHLAKSSLKSSFTIINIFDQFFRTSQLSMTTMLIVSWLDILWYLECKLFVVFKSFIEHTKLTLLHVDTILKSFNLEFEHAEIIEETWIILVNFVELGFQTDYFLFFEHQLLW